MSNAKEEQANEDGHDGRITLRRVLDLRKKHSVKRCVLISSEALAQNPGGRAVAIQGHSEPENERALLLARVARLVCRPALIA